MAFYFVALLLSSPQNHTLKNTTLNFLYFLGITVFTAALGFIINEWSDIADDKIAQKHNHLADSSSAYKVILLSGTLLGITLTLFVMTWNLKSILLYAIQISLLLLYSLKPFRFKRYKILALIIDALYSGTLFYILAICLYSNKLNYLLLASLSLWAFVRGLRNFLLHLISDANFDKQLDFKTIATYYDKEKIMHFLKIYLLPLEIISFITLLLQLPYNFIFISSYIIFLIYIHQRQQYIIPFLVRRKSIISTNILREVNLYYELFFIYILIFVLALNQVYFLIFIPIALLLFPKSFNWFKHLF
ncbi:MAG: UbiA family prenyltransferase [Chitinophagales bacterium]|nr:UbiA family prenyltransferase [Chitinophagales bacterium]